MLTILTITAASLGFFHTLQGSDHYVPFIVMARARRWSLFKTGWITLLYGLGHIGSSVLLGLIGGALGLAVKNLEVVESFRGNLAAWGLIAFGLVYFIWGMRKALKIDLMHIIILMMTGSLIDTDTFIRKNIRMSMKRQEV